MIVIFNSILFTDGIFQKYTDATAAEIRKAIISKLKNASALKGVSKSKKDN